MCRSYHDTRDPEEEFVGRVAYEFMFDFLSEKDLKSGNMLDARIRDDGHHQRMINLCKKIDIRI
jgi:hypothetical protein